MDQFERSVGAGAVADLVKAYGGEYHLPVWGSSGWMQVFERLVQVTARKDVLTAVDRTQLDGSECVCASGRIYIYHTGPSAELQETFAPAGSSAWS